jgi:hypothetical protein
METLDLLVSLIKSNSLLVTPITFILIGMLCLSTVAVIVGQCLAMKSIAGEGIPINLPIDEVPRFAKVQANYKDMLERIEEERQR